MHFQDPRRAIHRRPHTEVGHSGTGLAISQCDAHRPDAIGWRELLVNGDVGGGTPELAAESTTLDDWA